MKDKRKILAIKIVVPTLVAGGLIGTNYLVETYATDIGTNPVIVCEKAMEGNNVDNKPLEIVQRYNSKSISGLSQFLGVTPKGEILAGIGLNKDEMQKKYKGKKFNDIQGETENDKVYDDLYGKVYKIDLKSLEKSVVKSEKGDIQTKNVGTGLSPDGEKLEYVENEKGYFCNLLNGKVINYNKEMMYAKWSKDGKYLISCSENKISLYNIKENITKEITLKDTNKIKIYNYSSIYSEDGKDVYFIGTQKKGENLKRQGIFKINVQTEDIQETMVLPYVNKNSRTESSIPGADYRFIDGGKKIVLNATINDEDGVYIYDVESKKFFKIVNTIKTKEGLYCPGFWISPDGGKLAYVNKTEQNANNDKWNLYVAKINGHSLTNRITIEKNIYMGGSVDKKVYWSCDSKKMYFFEVKDKLKGDTISVSDENYIKSVTFK